MHSPHGFQLLDETAPSAVLTGHHLAAQGGGATPVLLGLLSALVTIGIAVTGWKLAHHWRRVDNHRADLTELAKTLRRIRVHVQLLADQDALLTEADCPRLRTLMYELAGADAASTPTSETTQVVTEVVTELHALLNTAVPTATGAGSATVTQARAQGRAVQVALAAITRAQGFIHRLRDR